MRKYREKTGWDYYLPLTYGILPSFDDFSFAFDIVCTYGKYDFTKDKYVGTCQLTDIELWEKINKFTQNNDLVTGEVYNDRMKWVSNILSRLGWEWL